jgi:hypothetical protein
MSIGNFARVSAVFLLVVSLSGCAGTTVQNVWQDHTYTGKVTSVLVLGATKDRAIRRLYESELSSQLQAKGVTAIPSFSLFMTDDVMDKQSILDKAHENNVDSVIITQVLDVKSYRERITDISHLPRHPGFFGHSDCFGTFRSSCGWHDSFWDGFSTVRTYDVEYLVSHAETELFLLDGDRLVWSVLTETETVDDIEVSVRKMVAMIVGQLEKDGLI